jgi:transketolase
MPNLLTIRPADGNEVSGAYLIALENKTRPSVLALSRQNLPQLEGSSIEAVQKGAYVLSGPLNPKLVLVSTGSEVSLCVQVAKKLSDKAIRVVSMPCQELFDEQPESYRSSVFPKSVPVLSVEAACTFGWQKYASHSIGIDSFGSSGPYQEVYAKFGLTVDAIADKASKLC